MATPEELEERLSALEQSNQHLFNITLELIEASLDLSQGARMQQHDELLRSRGEDAFQAIGRAIDQLKAKQRKENGNS